jgi:DNA-binding response OmpR family regulator
VASTAADHKGGGTRDVALRPVLVVDDEEQTRSSLCELLSSAGYEVSEAGDGRAALACAQRSLPDVVLLDVKIRDFHGFEVCRRLRALYGFATAIIFLSGSRTEPYDRIAGLEAGGDDYIVKPFDPGELLARIGAHVRRLEATRPASAKPDSPLTPRQEQIVTLLARGESVSAIASQLVVSTATVRKHLERIHKRIGARSRAEVVAWAYETGLASSSAPGS